MDKGWCCCAKGVPAYAFIFAFKECSCATAAVETFAASAACTAELNGSPELVAARLDAGQMGEALSPCGSGGGRASSKEPPELGGVLLPRVSRLLRLLLCTLCATPGCMVPVKDFGMVVGAVGGAGTDPT